MMCPKCGSVQAETALNCTICGFELLIKERTVTRSKKKNKFTSYELIVIIFFTIFLLLHLYQVNLVYLAYGFFPFSLSLKIMALSQPLIIIIILIGIIRKKNWAHWASVLYSALLLMLRIFSIFGIWYNWIFLIIWVVIIISSILVISNKNKLKMQK